MQTPQPINNSLNNSQISSKIAIVGMNVHFGYGSLDAFERSIYEGKHLSDTDSDTDNVEHFLSSREIQQKFEDIVSIALKDAAIDSNKNIAIAVANGSKHKLNKLNKLNSSVIEVDSVFDALLLAQRRLNDVEAVEAVVVAGVDLQGMGVVVLKRYETAKRDRHKIYAVIDCLSFSSSFSLSVTAQNVAYLELVADRRLEEVNIEQEVADYLATYAAGSCAISSLANAGYHGITLEIASLIKTALALYYRYLPPVPQWQQQKPSDRHPFYVTSFAKPWFLAAGVQQRVAAINIISQNAQIILAEEVETQQRSNTYLEQMPCYLFPLAVKDSTTLWEQLDTLKQTLSSGDLAQTAQQTFAAYQHSQGNYTLAIIGKNKLEILKECDRAAQGVAKAWETGKDWQTPVGSYFTPNPQGKKGKVAYVYPGAYNTHLGLGKDLFRLFPNLIDEPVIQTTCNRIAGIEKLLYPRSWHKLSPRELEAKERELMNDPLAMLESETGFAGLMTTILRDYFQLLPQAAFGYSLGETSMMYAQGVWDDIEQSSNVLNTSTLFKTRLAGTKEAIREYWQLSDEPGELWCTYVVMANSEVVKEKLQKENRVYLTQISTNKEVVIAGDPQSCARVIASLGCDAFRAPFNHAIHCEAMKSEYGELIKLNTLPLRNSPKITFYSAANYQEIALNSQDIAHNLTQTLCQQLDFPRLVDRVYQDDYRIFIEVGVGSNCSRWIKDILKSKEHATISLHRRGTNDFTSLIKAIAKLCSHRVQLNLSCLYGVEDSLSPQPRINSFNNSLNNSLNNNTVDLWHESTENNESSIFKITQETRKNELINQKKIIKPQTSRVISHNVVTTSNELNTKTILSDTNNSSKEQSTYLNTIKAISSSNNSQLSKAQSLFIQRDYEYSLNNQEAISLHLEALKLIVNEEK
jgi:PfaB family protein